MKSCIDWCIINDAGVSVMLRAPRRSKEVNQMAGCAKKAKGKKATKKAKKK